VLPSGWEAIHSDSVWVRGRPTALHAAHGDPRGRFSGGEESDSPW
jgi:hypothetical protein